MKLHRLVLLSVAAAAGAAAPARALGPAEPRASIVASVGHSEWCPSGRARLDLGTGRYTVTAPRTWRTCRAPGWPTLTRTGVLAAADLAAVRTAWQRIEAEGLDEPACRNGGRPDTIVLSNGGARTLRLTRRGRTVSAPEDESCWSDAASRLHNLLRTLFDPRRN